MDEHTTGACLHFFCGMAGAGKSTVARAVAQSAQATLISEDVWLARLYGDQMQQARTVNTMLQRAAARAGRVIARIP
jgi:predicted kinase